MKKIDPERQTRQHLLITSGSMLGAVGLFFWAFSAAGNARDEYQQATREIQQAAQKQQAQRSAVEERSRLLPIYLEIAQSALEKPIEAQSKAEKLLDLQRELQIPALRYEFQPQVTLSTPDQARFTFTSQPLKVQLDLLHEEDLLRFLDQLPERSSGMIKIKHCQLARSKHTALSADCEIDWVTLVQKTP